MAVLQLLPSLPLLLLCCSVIAAAAADDDGRNSQPNIVYILTDDQDVKLGSLEVQPAVKSLITEQGLYFNNAFVTTPVCCPSRSSILTGKYVHNHHTYENSVGKGCDAPSWRELNENKTIGLYMSQAGYRTGFFGKYLNNYGFEKTGVGVDHIPPGWTRWYTLRGNSVYYNYVVSNQGKAEEHKDNYSTDYLTDNVRRAAVEFIHSSEQDTPFFMYIATPAPHRPATPAPQYARRFAGKPAPRTPSFGGGAKDKHWLLSEGTPPLNSTITSAIDELYELRLESLLSVDDLVTAVFQALEHQGLINNTFIFYNSDHGYHLGQFNQQGEKRQPYEEDIRVPLIVRGPGVKSNSKTDALALSIDLAPTFLDLAGWPLPDDMDGESLKSVILGEEEAEQEETSYRFLIEYFGAANPGSECFFGTLPVPFLHDCHNNTFLALRVYDEGKDYIYSEFFLSDNVPLNTSQIYFSEYYDLVKDNWQLENQVHTLSEKQVQEFKDTIMAFHTCHGSLCHKLRKKQ